jgi:DNA-binding transcriptional ArsR family regulator
MAAETFAVLAEPVRRRVLDLLLDGPRPVGELAGLLGLSQPGTSKHLRVLREAGLVQVRQDAQRRWYELRPGPLAEIDAWLRPYRELWARHLDALEYYLDAGPADGPGERPAGLRPGRLPAGPTPGQRPAGPTLRKPPAGPTPGKPTEEMSS